MTEDLNQLLGLTDTQPLNGLAWHVQVQGGLEPVALKNLAKALNVTQKALAELVTPGHKTPSKGLLSREASNFLYRIALTLSQMTIVAKMDATKAATWLKEPQPLFRGRVPLLMLRSHHGAEYVYAAVARAAG